MMKIDATTSIYAVQRYQMIANKTNVQNTETQGKDDIDISGEAVSFAKVFTTAKTEFEKTENTGESSRVKAVRDMMDAGRFAVEPERIADSILMFI